MGETRRLSLSSILSSNGFSNFSSVLAVHGLSSDSQGSWTFKDDQRESRRNWLTELLPQCLPISRIMTWTYNVDPLEDNILTEKGFKANTITMLEELGRRRETDSVRTRRLLLCRKARCG